MSSRPILGAHRSTNPLRASLVSFSRFVSSESQPSASSTVSQTFKHTPAAPSISRDNEKKYSLLSSESGFVNSPPPSSASELTNDWWRRISTSSTSSNGYPGNQYSGRSYLVYKSDYATGYKRVMASLNRANVRSELRLSEFYEKPSVRKTRLASERHRRRFQEEVRKRVQLVQALRNRQ